jgi:hypothetical protein
MGFIARRIISFVDLEILASEAGISWDEICENQLVERWCG